MAFCLGVNWRRRVAAMHTTRSPVHEPELGHRQDHVINQTIITLNHVLVIIIHTAVN